MTALALPSSAAKRRSGGTTNISFPADRARTAINLLSPVRLFVWTLVLFGVGFVAAPITPDISVSFGAAFCWISVFVMSIAGAALAIPKGLAIRGDRFMARRFPARKIARRCIAIGVTGVMLSVIDRYFVRGAPLGFDILLAREVLTDSGTGMLGLLAAAAAAFAPLGLISAWLARALGEPVSKRTEIAAFVSLLLYMILSIALGSRSLVVVCALMHVLSALFFQILRRGRVNWGAILSVCAIATALIVGSAWLMIERLDQMGMSPIASIQFSGYAYTLKPSANLVDALNASDQLGYFGAGLYSLVIYAYHGFYEFCLLYDNFTDSLLLGAKHLWLPLKVLSVLTDFDFSIDLSQLSGFRDGVYTTMVGPMYLDFGWCAPLFAFYLFLALSYPYRRLVLGDWRWFAATVQVAMIIIMAPVTSLLDSSVGIFPLLAATVLPFLASQTERHDRSSSLLT
jgi:hypothetical protein